MHLLDPPRARTLRLKLPCGQTLTFAMVLLGLLLVLGEVVARTASFRAHVVPVSRGGRHYEFQHHLGLLETVVAKDGPVDCIFLGTSMVWYGFDTEAFARAYRRRTGQEIRCFNFGVAAMPAAAAGTLAQVLAADYRPGLLIYGTSAQDYAISKDSEDATVLLEMSWLQYHLGKFSIEGWLWDHCHLCQYRETLAQLLRFEDRWLLLTGFFAAVKGNYGFVGREGVRQTVSVPPNPESKQYADEYLFGLLSDYEIYPENLLGLQQVMAQDSPDTQVLIVEMPRPISSLYYFGNGQQDQQRFIDEVESMAESRAIPFWQTTELNLIPEDGWWDYSHLNSRGARIFSEWLGEQIGIAVLRGTLENPVAKR